MQASARQQELERLYNARKGHVPQISISDDSHHITEAIGSYYGSPNEQDLHSMSVRADTRPLSFISGPSESRFTATPRSPTFSPRRNAAQQNISQSPPSPQDRSALLSRAGSNDRLPSASQSEGNGSPTGLKRMGSVNNEESSNASTPSLSRHNSTDTAVQPFPLNDIDYESSPAAVAQELSNLQAIRRMSMNVDTADPDLPAFGSIGSIPSSPPGNSTSDDDPSKLFWVPARLHPELAPKEFKTFVEERVDKIRRRSGSEDSLSPVSPDRTNSDASLHRKKSMLSHTIDTAGVYEDGAERLERQRSQRAAPLQTTSLNDLEHLVNDPVSLVGRISLEQRTSEDSGSDGPGGEDVPILPAMQPSLKRSTHTTYRKGSLRRGERQPFSKRALSRQNDDEEPLPNLDLRTIAGNGADVPIMGLTRVQTEPIPEPHQDRAERSRFGSGRRKPVHVSASLEDFKQNREESEEQYRDEEQYISRQQSDRDRNEQEQLQLPSQQPLQAQFGAQPAAYEQSSQQAPRQHPVDSRADQEFDQSQSQHVVLQQQLQSQSQQQSQPQQQQQPVRQFHSRIASQGRTTAQLPGYNNTNPLPHIIETLPDGTKVPVGPLATQSFPERKSSYEHQRPSQRGGAHSRPVPGRQANPSTTLDDISSNPSALPGSGATRTDALTMVPTFDEKKADKKDGGRKSSWKWVFGNDEEKSKDGKKSFDDNASIKSGKSSKSSKQDKARLDVLQSSIDGSNARPRESLVLNRDEINIEDDRKHGKKSSESSRKDTKEPSLLSAIFGGKKKSSENDAKEKKRRNDRPISPEPPPRVLKPDIDYNWTRFSILEERAIYRMAHIKLANPRRALHSQVLLSNFMYSYLAKVQMMHPQMNIPASQQQKMQQEQQRQQKQQQQQQPSQDAPPSSSEYQEYQRWQEHDSQSPAEQQQHAPHTGYESDNARSYEHERQENAEHYDSRSSEEHSEWPSANTNYGQAVHMNGNGHAQQHGSGGYSVASGQDYAGYAKDSHHGNAYGNDQMWEGEEESEDLW